MELLVLVVIISVCALQLILFFKIWGACNNVKKIRIIAEEELEISFRSKIEKIIAKFGGRTEGDRVIDRELVRRMLMAYRYKYLYNKEYDGLSFVEHCKGIADDVAKKYEKYALPKELGSIFRDVSYRHISIRLFLEI